MPIGISIVICCYNSADRVPETLKCLAQQVAASAIEWEIIVVDNASTDKTGEIAQNCCPEVIRSRLQVVREPAAGLSHARIRGFRSARYSIISFIDDDNWVPPEWLATLVQIFSSDPEIGVVGGPSEAVFELPAPPWFSEIQGFYAVGPQHRSTGDVTEATGTILWGAGMSIRKAALDALWDQGFQFLSTGRKGAQLLAGEDIEMGFALRALGWRFYYDERLRLRHYIPAGRLTWNYALKLMKGMGMTSVYLNIYCSALGLPPFDNQPAYKRSWVFQFLKSVKNFVLQFLCHPVSSLTQPAGDRNGLDFVRSLGTVLQLIALRKDYKSTILKIKSARWNPTQ